LPGVEPEVVPICVQFAEKYILSPTRDGVLVIDQYRAHMKILYERFMKASAETSATSSSQRLMFPEIVELDAIQSALLESVTDELRQIGFLIEKGEGDSWRIMGVPALLGKENPREVVMQILALTMDFETEASAHAQLSSPLEDMLSRISLAAAKSGAVKGGQKLSNSEMEHIISELFSLPDPMYTPEGNPILRTISASYITSLF
jgi:DNA mismatch repair protein MutL